MISGKKGRYLLSFKYMTKKIILAALILGIGVMVMGAVLMFGSTATAAEAGTKDVCVPESECKLFFDGSIWHTECSDNGCDGVDYFE